MSTPHHPAVEAFLESLRAANKASTAWSYGIYLRKFENWLTERRVDVLLATTDILIRYQVWLADTYRQDNGEPLAKTTQCTAVVTVKTLYRWLTKRGIVLVDPAAPLIPPKPPESLTVRKDHLTLQEATALIQALGAQIEEAKPGSDAWALGSRNLAMVSIALATGRRCSGLVHLRMEHIDLERNEVRIEWEKGKAGRVLPVAAWAMGTVRHYLERARPVLLGERTSEWLFVSQRADRICARGFVFVLDAAMAETIRRNPDLTDLPAKRISTHSLRVSFASMMFENGCNIRSLNEMMLHENLTTTARYTPIPIEDLRRVLLTAHPRA